VNFPQSEQQWTTSPWYFFTPPRAIPAVFAADEALLARNAVPSLLSGFFARHGREELEPRLAAIAAVNELPFIN
jgi:hypothetical protein